MRLKAVLALIGAAGVAVAIASGASGAVASSPCSGGAGGGGIVIDVLGSPSVSCSPAAIQANVDVTTPTQYEVCGPLGKGCHQVSVNPAISIKHLLHIAGVEAVQLVEVVPPRGSPSILESGGLGGGYVLLDPSPVYVGPAGAGSSFEEINAPGGGPLELRAYRGRLLHVSIAESTGHAAPGARVQFSASPTGRGFTYIWNSPTGRAITDTNAITLTVNGQGAGGKFDVYVTVIGPDGGAGASLTPGEVNVAPAPAKSQLNPPGTTGKKNHSSSGGSGGASLNGTTGTTTTPTTTTPTTPTTSTFTPPPVSNSLGQQAHPRSSRPPSAAPPGLGQKVVEGRLISDVTPVSAAALASSNGGANTTTSQPQVRSTPPVTGSLTLGAGLAAAGVIILLLGSGAGRELRSLRRSIASARLA